MKTYSVKYFPNGNTSKYVGSIADYKDGGSTDFIPMSKEQARQLLSELNEYVKTEYIGKNDDENEQAHYAFEKGEWGFAIDTIEIPDDDDKE